MTCPKGHPLNAPGRCRACNRENAKARYAVKHPQASVLGRPRKPPEPTEPIDPYVPLDVLLADPTVRLLRALRHFDECYTAELLAAAGAPERSEDMQERQRYSSAIRQAQMKGLVESTSPGCVRITPAGRQALKNRLSVANVGADGG